ncbi:uncharacterized protein EV420DRAFT_798379 [Desarmillaria tabescens]|uniref:Uncharacterized protein n=1 Tax=Armillaria tabescens TaxID=1929756 RepID=A0AA39TPA4_ARMTA|nr:uncharacterized protein EV420DRAFT_798379 [Desarmillaria tabescens]KAK0465867.1 hypothetical protein EV420DRAFT_798379 [Desarmillaria tabescens]
METILPHTPRYLRQPALIPLSCKSWFTGVGLLVVWMSDVSHQQPDPRRPTFPYNSVSTRSSSVNCFHTQISTRNRFSSSWWVVMATIIDPTLPTETTKFCQITQRTEVRGGGSGLPDAQYQQINHRLLEEYHYYDQTSVEGTGTFLGSA